MKDATRRYLKEKSESLSELGLVRTEILYDGIDNEYVSRIFAVLHCEFNRLFKFMYGRKDLYYKAEHSRKLINYIELYEDVKYYLRNTEYAFSLEKAYLDLVVLSKGFLRSTHGSNIPEDLPVILIVEDKPIFFIENTIEVSIVVEAKRYQKKLIGVGSYAKVYSYKDEFYGKKYVVKKALDTLDEKEIKRFEKEYKIMKILKSPYILEVYNYNPYNNEYIVEYADETIYDYIQKNNNKLDEKMRYQLILQILNGFEYIHNEGYLHRDISYTNVLIKHYDDTSIIKIADFGLVKEKNSNLTSVNTEIKGSLNDHQLEYIGFSKYEMIHETFALTRLIFYVLTGKKNCEKIKEPCIRDFFAKGTNSNKDERYKNVQEIRYAIKIIFRSEIFNS